MAILRVLVRFSLVPQDNHRAAVVGSQTLGKALVQAVHSLSDGSGLAVTVAHYYTPKGDISHKGITPNIKIELTEAQSRQLAANPALVGTQNDPQYARALTVLATNTNAGVPSIREQVSTHKRRQGGFRFSLFLCPSPFLRCQHNC